MAKLRTGRGRERKEHELLRRLGANGQARAAGPSLLDKLLGRAGVASVPPAPVVVAPKRKRGRPSKASLEAAKVWDEVTGGAGVVLVDGKEVPPQSP